MSDADLLDAHPELVAARRVIADAHDKLLAIEGEALRLAQWPIGKRSRAAMWFHT